jgi:hypothetical protein
MNLWRSYEAINCRSHVHVQCVGHIFFSAHDGQSHAAVFFLKVKAGVVLCDIRRSSKRVQ